MSTAVGGSLPSHSHGVPRRSRSSPGLPGLTISTRALDDMLVVALFGPLDVYTVFDFRRHLDDDRRGVERLAIDLTGVTLLDSSGLRALLHLRNRAQRNPSARLGLICPRRDLFRLFEIAGLSEGFEFGLDLPDLRASMSMSSPDTARLGGPLGPAICWPQLDNCWTSQPGGST